MTGTKTGGYISDLSREIRGGGRRLPETFRGKQSQYIRAQQKRDGGFGGRKGGADLYYTHFGLWASDVLDVPPEDDCWQAAAGFLQHHAPEPNDIPDCLALAHGVHILEARGYQVDDDAARKALKELVGGYFGKGPDSLYDAFLAGLAAELLGLREPPKRRVIRFVKSRKCRDGGFADLSGGRTGGINPTAAGAALLGICDGIDDSTVEELAGFVTGTQRPDGGFPAHADAPCADLMSTFTAMVTLRDLDILDRADLAGAARFARDLREPDGGFKGAQMHDRPDVEYTFYGLGVLGLLSAHAVRAREQKSEMSAGGSCCT